MVDRKCSGRLAASVAPFSSDAVAGEAFLAGDHPIFLVDLDTRRILACGGAVTRIFGYEPREVIGERTRLLHVDERAYRDFASISASTVLERGGTFHSYYRMRRKDGTTFPSEHFVQLVADADGVPHAGISIVRDLGETSGERVTQALERVERPDFEELTENLPGAVFQRVTAPDGTDRYTFLSGSLFRDYGVDPEPIFADPQQLVERVDPRDRQLFESELERSDRFLRPLDMELRLRTHGEAFVWLRLLSQPRRLEDGSIVRDGFALDITRQRHAEEQLHFLATHDALTGIMNRFQFLERLQERIDGAMPGKASGVVASLNPRGMMRLNHARGRLAGDAVLQDLSTRLLAAFGEEALVARCVGDHFVIAVPGTADEVQAAEVLEALYGAFTEPFELADGTRLPLSGRFGIARYPEDGQDAAALLNAADLALERARRQADADYALYDPDFARELQQRTEREAALAGAIDNGELRGYFQPQISLADGAVIGFEALARWVKSDGALVSPSDFIPIAEESGLIIKLGVRILQDVLAAVATWQRAGLTVPSVSVNCSAQQLLDGDFERHFRASLDATGVAPGQVTIEVTETSVLHDFASTERKMRALEAIGVQFSIDDFGTGYSSLSYLARLPFHELKIDRSFVSNVVTDPRQRSIVQGLVQMAKALGLFVVAEGLESREQEAALRNMGCDAGQGFLYSPAVPFADAEQWLTASS